MGADDQYLHTFHCNCILDCNFIDDISIYSSAGSNCWRRQRTLENVHGEIYCCQFGIESVSIHHQGPGDLDWLSKISQLGGSTEYYSMDLPATELATIQFCCFEQMHRSDHHFLCNEHCINCNGGVSHFHNYRTGLSSIGYNDAVEIERQEAIR